MFHIKELRNRINALHEGALRITYQDSLSSFEELLKIDKSVSIHHRNLQNLLIEICKIKMEVSASIIYDIMSLNQNTSYNLWLVSL